MSTGEPSQKTTTTITKTETEVVLNGGTCKSCQVNKTIIVVQGVFNIAFIVLFVILFIMVTNLKSNMEDSIIIGKRAKRLQEPSSSYSKSLLQRLNKTKNSLNRTNRTTTTTTTTTTEAPLLDILEILDDYDIPASIFLTTVAIVVANNRIM